MATDAYPSLRRYIELGHSDDLEAKEKSVKRVNEMHLTCWITDLSRRVPNCDLKTLTRSTMELETIIYCNFFHLNFSFSRFCLAFRKFFSKF